MKASLVIPAGLLFICMAWGKPTAQRNPRMKSKNSIGTILVTAGTTSKQGLKSYRQWKNERIREAMTRVSFTRYRLDHHQTLKAPASALSKESEVKSQTEAIASADISLVQLEKQMGLDLMSLEMAKDLTVTDYFVGYVSRRTHKADSMKEIAGKMSKDEVAELMQAYAESIFGSVNAEIPTSATNHMNKESAK